METEYFWVLEQCIFQKSLYFSKLANCIQSYCHECYVNIFQGIKWGYFSTLLPTSIHLFLWLDIIYWTSDIFFKARCLGNSLLSKNHNLVKKISIVLILYTNKMLEYWRIAAILYRNDHVCMRKCVFFQR